ncbi:ATP-binding cassette domain-containing protein [Globicatella sulfidifaciens]|uniref:ATP-binding cassette domain-containing protein n=1 Tax=Globicatella sulfidifaciens TaxID=136093 RepID=A0A7X8C5G6_9LACT|nr:ATP-binding cassette domain-containing protein [Globicatella sulfidifaciens]NLJ19336.1 ATP-binding cassette domain-containing protein [Globicatella sulfidifaciens]
MLADISSLKLEVNNISKNYAEIKALDNISLEFRSGIYGLLGPNGAGKSTLMNILVGNTKPNQGVVLFNGLDIAVLDQNYRKHLGYMPQQQILYDDFTGVQFLSYIASLKSMSNKQAKQEIPQLLQSVNLTDDANRNIGEYSGGMKQRLLLAQALLNQPKILILDEPTAGLDPYERIRLKNILSGLSKECLVILATHIVSDIEQISDKVILIRKGKLLIQGTSGELENNLSGKVFELSIPSEDFGKFKESHNQALISSIKNNQNDVIIRIVTDDITEYKHQFKSVLPNLEDVYLYYLEKHTN